MTIATIMIALVLAAVLVAAIAPSLILQRQLNQTPNRYPTQYDRMIAEFARRRRAESATAPAAETSRQDIRRVAASTATTLRQRHS
jgi:predicted PurR-regulated permease PerM